MAHPERGVVLEAAVEPEQSADSGVQLYIIQHKEARSGKRCPLEIDEEMLGDLQMFARHLAKENPEKTPKGYLFTTKDGNQVSPTNMSKIIDAASAAFAKRIGEDLPKITGSGQRKLAVTTHREAGADRVEQTALASHMAHKVDTADRYYNKGQMKETRSKAVKRVTAAYKEAAKVHEQEKGKKGKKRRQSSTKSASDEEEKGEKGKKPRESSTKSPSDQEEKGN